MEQIERIAEKLKELRILDKNCSVFGSSRHHHSFNEPLTEEEIRIVENENEISLSEDYKTILKYLGNGGAGPGYGLEALSLKHIHPPYIGTQQLLRNWPDPNKIEIEMVDSDEISGYVKLFDYGCGMQTCLIVTGEEAGNLIFFDCDDRFEKLENSSLLYIYDRWLDYTLEILKRVKAKLMESSLEEVIDSEWALDNYDIKEMVLSLIGGEPLSNGGTGNDKKAHLENEYKKWKA